MNKLATNALVIVGAIGGAFIGRWAVDGVFSKSTDYTGVLMLAANQINANLPMTIDSDTQLVSTAGVNDSFTYKYKLVNYDTENMDIDQFKESMLSQLKNATCTSGSMSEFRKMQIVVKYSYMDSSHKEIAEFPIDTKDCEKI